MAISKSLLLWFTRLRASGAYNPKCSASKGRCKSLTEKSKAALKKTPFANVNKKSKKGAYKKMLTQAKSNDKNTPQERKALLEAVSKSDKSKNVTVTRSSKGTGRTATVRTRGKWRQGDNTDVKKQVNQSQADLIKSDKREAKKKASFKKSKK